MGLPARVFLLSALVALAAARPIADELAARVASGAVDTWAAKDVAAFLGKVGFPSSVTAAVVANGIDGNVLRYLTADDAKEALAISAAADVARFRALADAIAGTGAPTASPPPSHAFNLWTLRRRKPAAFQFCRALLQFFPRVATLYFSRAQPNALGIFDGRPDSAKFSWFYWIIFPEAMTVDHFDACVRRRLRRARNWARTHTLSLPHRFIATNPVTGRVLAYGAAMTGLGNLAYTFVCLSLMANERSKKFGQAMCATWFGIRVGIIAVSTLTSLLLFRTITDVLFFFEIWGGLVGMLAFFGTLLAAPATILALFGARNLRKD